MIVSRSGIVSAKHLGQAAVGGLEPAGEFGVVDQAGEFED